MLVLVLTETTVPVPSRDTWEMQIPGPPGARPGAAPRDRAPGGCRGAAGSKGSGVPPPTPSAPAAAARADLVHPRGAFPPSAAVSTAVGRKRGSGNRGPRRSPCPKLT